MDAKPVNHSMTGWSMAGALASVMLLAGLVPAYASDLSDRVSSLEQSLANRNQSNLDLLNRVQDLQSQLQQQQGQIEELQHQLQQTNDQGKAQYLDLDSRLERLEGQGAVAGAGAATSSVAAEAAAKPAAQKAAAQAAAKSPSKAQPTTSSGNAQADYGKAIDILQAGHYTEAAQAFGDFIAHYPKDVLASNAVYWQGEAFYADSKYQSALASFQQLLRQYPASGKAPDAQLKLGYTQDQLKQTAEATATLQSVMAKYPNSKVAGLAKERLQSIRLQAANP